MKRFKNDSKCVELQTIVCLLGELCSKGMFTIRFTCIQVVEFVAS